MAIYAIADLHLSFLVDKPMNVFGENWENHTEKIKKNWKQKVKKQDTVILLGDFSWAMYLNNTKLDFEYLNSLPGTKILLKGNHDYWWSTLNKMNEFVKENNFEDIYFLYNNSYLIENKIIVGARGWNVLDMENDKKMIKRESSRMELSIIDGIKKYGKDKEIIACMHYPPINKSDLLKGEKTDFINIFEKYDIHKCYYGHLHGTSHNDAVEGIFENIQYKLVSADYLNFDLLRI